jgi:hypothetical protein
MINSFSLQLLWAMQNRRGGSGQIIIGETHGKNVKIVNGRRTDLNFPTFNFKKGKRYLHSQIGYLHSITT